jgi:hypothetical protein
MHVESGSLGRFAPQVKIDAAQALLGEVSLAIAERMNLPRCLKVLWAASQLPTPEIEFEWNLWPKISEIHLTATNQGNQLETYSPKKRPKTL